MCTGMEIALLSAATSAGGALMQSNAADDAANEQRSIYRAAEEENQRLNKAGEQSINDFAKETFDPAKREQNYEQAATERETSLAEALSGANIDATGATGAVSSDYLTARKTSADAGGLEAARRAKLLARTGASGLLGSREAMKGGELASDLADIGVKSARNSRYATSQAANVSGDSLAGGLMSGLGAAGMSAAGGMMGGATPKRVPIYPGAGY